MNRLVGLIPVVVVVALLALTFVLIPMLRTDSDRPGATKAPDNLPAPPTVNVEGDFTHEFGPVVIADRRELKHTFTIRNAEDRAIDLFVEGTSCNCLAGALSTNTLAPGATARIEVTLEVHQSGPTVQKVYLNANGALVILQVSADVMRTGDGSDVQSLAE